jgi:putative PLP-dependent aminotransferase (TIGR04422 family)
MTQIDYQWPSSLLNYPKYDNDSSSKSAGDTIKRIEDFFTQHYGCYACLMPSGRASISLLLRYLNFDRSKTVFIPKWSSNCLYSCISPYSNISTDFINPDLILAVHKWGYKSYLHDDYSTKIIIEDSVDTIHLDDSSLFQNKGKAEIISLPKIVGSLSGGLILTRDNNLLEYIRMAQKSNLEFGSIQSKKKQNSAGNDWEYYEHINTSLDKAALQNIENNMHNLYKNINFISRRREIISKKFSDISFDFSRLGPLIVFPKSKYNIRTNKVSFMERQFNFSMKIDENSCYKSAYLLPVHFRILDSHFQSLYDSLEER